MYRRTRLSSDEMFEEVGGFVSGNINSQMSNVFDTIYLAFAIIFILSTKPSLTA